MLSAKGRAFLAAGSRRCNPARSCTHRTDQDSPVHRAAARGNGDHSRCRRRAWFHHGRRGRISNSSGRELRLEPGPPASRSRRPPGSQQPSRADNPPAHSQQPGLRLVRLWCPCRRYRQPPPAHAALSAEPENPAHPRQASSNAPFSWPHAGCVGRAAGSLWRLPPTTSPVPCLAAQGRSRVPHRHGRQVLFPPPIRGSRHRSR